jgi:hypothetical protein
MPSRVTWYPDRIKAITTTIPQKAFDGAARSSARLAAVKAGGGGIGAELAHPKRIGTLHALVGTSKVYGPIQQWGGTIRPKRPGGRLLIGANRGRITASAKSVTIVGKHFLEAAAGSFPQAYVSNLRKLMP